MWVPGLSGTATPLSSETGVFRGLRWDGIRSGTLLVISRPDESFAVFVLVAALDEGGSGPVSCADAPASRVRVPRPGLVTTRS
ncbi:hypothetical protein GP2_041_00230 [Gordonia paraffinivorans NBRC 108238]|uniref:Uncharacterized protein n=1 Tax=Gordonia paraffinivorans NBRC 108238 TaxID=1223543 RepID=A0ABQ0IQB3_9ACTN|nr:hypothetical protein GP2_041_00230 [Gordonia paraffinivorans NBRC 108238]